MSKKFRKRPVVIEAVEWTGDNVDELHDFAGSKFLQKSNRDPAVDLGITAEVFDDFHSTWIGVKTGQWIIKGVQGEFYPIDPNVLAETYEEVDDA